MNHTRVLKRLVALFVVFLSMTAAAAAAVHASPPRQDAPRTLDADATGVVRVVGIAPQAHIQPDWTFALIDVSSALTGTTALWVPPAGQVVGRRVLDDATAVTFTVSLPISPTGAATVFTADGAGDFDAGGDGTPDEDAATAASGVQIYAAVAAPPLVGDSYLQLLEQRTDLRSIVRDVETGAVISGTLLVYAADAGRLFPGAPGDDGILFTQDDPLVNVPAGYTLAIVGPSGVTLDRPSVAVMPLHAPASPAPADLTDLPMVDAFDALLQELATRALPAARDAADWQALGDRFRADVEAAAADDDPGAFFTALYQLAQAAGDGLVSVEPGDDSDPAVTQAFAVSAGSTQGSLGVEIAALGDGRVIVTDVAGGSPAAAAGLTPGAELLAVNDVPVTEAIDAVQVAGSPATATARRLAQVAALLRAPLDAEVTLEFAPPDGSPETVTLAAGQFPLRRPFSVAGQPMPVTYRFLNNVGYLAAAEFTPGPVHALLLEQFVRELNRRDGEGVILDLRGNPGGDLAGMLTFAAFFYGEDAPLDAANLRVRGVDAADALREEPFTRGLLAAPHADATFAGPLVLLVDDACRGACELLAALVQASGRGEVIAQYATAGKTGEVQSVLLPGGIAFRFPVAEYTVAGVDAPIRGAGVPPDVAVPVTLESETAMASGADPLVAAALDYLDFLQLESVPLALDFVGVTSVGPRGWRYDEDTRQLRRRDGSGLTVIPQQGDDVAAAVDEFVGNFQGTAELIDTVTLADREWALFAATVFGQNVRIAGTVEDGDTLLAVLFITNPDQVDLLAERVLMPFLENFALDE